MRTTFKKGFTHNRFIFGWHKGKLYRLPILRDGRNYPLKEIVLKPRGQRNHMYYLVAGTPMTELQAREKSGAINVYYNNEI